MRRIAFNGTQIKPRPAFLVQTRMTPRFSVVIPAFNSAATIAEAIQSVLDQTHQPLHLLVINDGSTDGTLEKLLREFDCEPTPDVYHRDLETKEILGLYRSRLYPNLYQIGDLLHISRPSGGYSLQLCWTTGCIAGENA